MNYTTHILRDIQQLAALGILPTQEQTAGSIRLRNVEFKRL